MNSVRIRIRDAVEGTARQGVPRLLLCREKRVFALLSAKGPCGWIRRVLPRDRDAARSTQTSSTR